MKLAQLKVLEEQLEDSVSSMHREWELSTLQSAVFVGNSGTNSEFRTEQRKLKGATLRK